MLRASTNEIRIDQSERKFHWPAPGPRPTDHDSFHAVKLSLLFRHSPKTGEAKMRQYSSDIAFNPSVKAIQIVN